MAIIIARMYVLEQRRYKKKVDTVLPSIGCKEPKRIKAVPDRYAFIAMEDIKKGDLLEVEPAYGEGSFMAYGDEGLCGNYWGVVGREHKDGSGCEMEVYKDGVKHDLGKFETTIIALEAAIEFLGDAESERDKNTLTQLKIWLEEENKKLQKNDSNN